MVITLRLELQQQAEGFLARQAVEHPHHRFDHLLEVDALGGQAQAAGFDAGDVEDVADQFQQILGRVVGHLDCRTVQVPLVGTF